MFVNLKLETAAHSNLSPISELLDLPVRKNSEVVVTHERWVTGESIFLLLYCFTRLMQRIFNCDRFKDVSLTPDKALAGQFDICDQSSCAAHHIHELQTFKNGPLQFFYGPPGSYKETSVNWNMACIKYSERAMAAVRCEPLRPGIKLWDATNYTTVADWTAVPLCDGCFIARWRHGRCQLDTILDVHQRRKPSQP